MNTAIHTARAVRCPRPTRPTYPPRRRSRQARVVRHRQFARSSLGPRRGSRRIGRTTNCRDGRPGGGSAAIPRRGGSPRDTDDPGRHQSRLGGRGCDTQVNGAAEGRGGEDGVFDQALNQDPTAGVRLLKPGRSEIPWRRARNRRGAQLSKAGGDHDYGVLAGQIRPVVHRGRPGVTAHSIRDGRQGRLLGPGSARAGRPAAGSGRPWGIRPPT